MEIREATTADAMALTRLRYEFRAAANVPVEDEAAFIARCAPWMAERLGGAGPWRCWVATVEGGIIGHLWLQLIEKIPNPAPELERHGYITNVYVREAHRGAGAAARMLEAALAHCREQGVDSVILWPTGRSRPLYRRHGFVEPGDMLEAILDPRRDVGGHEEIARG
jgi:GNAT superfamily N-acetyltransferase